MDLFLGAVPVAESDRTCLSCSVVIGAGETAFTVELGNPSLTVCGNCALEWLMESMPAEFHEPTITIDRGRIQVLQPDLDIMGSAYSLSEAEHMCAVKVRQYAEEYLRLPISRRTVDGRGAHLPFVLAILRSEQGAPLYQLLRFDRLAAKRVTAGGATNRIQSATRLGV